MSREDRSIALHAAVAAKIAEDPTLVEHARGNLERWMVAGGRSLPLWEQWKAMLDRPLDDILACLTERSEAADQLRRASPFAGILTPQERLRILRQTRDDSGS